MCGKEFCNAYTELNDPFEQRARFEEQASQIYVQIKVWEGDVLCRRSRRQRVTTRHKGLTRPSSTRSCLDHDDPMLCC